MGHDPNGFGRAFSAEVGQDIGTISGWGIEVRGLDDLNLLESAVLKILDQKFSFLRFAFPPAGWSDGRNGSELDLKVDHVVAKRINAMRDFGE